MADRMDLLSTRSYTTREGEAKTAFTKIGVAFATKSGGWSLTFEALPLPSLNDKGQLETRVLMMAPKEKTNGNAPAKDFSDIGARGDDDIPF